MKCPYCNDEMQFGNLMGDGRSRVRFQPEGTKLTFGDMLAGTGLIEAAKTKFVTCYIPTHYCDRCGKLIIDSKVTK